jgi:undecaprenyl-diphosphatase
LDYFQAIVLGLIQGITEWLPVSSKAMVSLAARFLFGIEYREALSSAIFLHSGTLVAASVYFRKEIIGIAKSAFDKSTKKDLLVFLAIATAITGIMGAPLLFIALNFEFPEWIFTMAVGILLIGMAILQKNRGGGTEKELRPKNAIIAGLAQGLAGIPGISRSGTTLAALLGEGYSLDDAMRLSFLMSIPAVLGVELALPLLKGGFEVTGELLAGSAVAGIVGFFTIDMLLKVAARPDFYKVTLVLGAFVAFLGAALFLQ